MVHKGGFKNIKLGKNVHRQIKRRGVPQQPPSKQSSDHIRLPRFPFHKPAEVPVESKVKGEGNLNKPED